MKFLTGKDYPWLCHSCQAAVDAMVEVAKEGPDTDDEEAPCTLAYDHKMFCSSGGQQCLHHMQVTEGAKFVTCQCEGVMVNGEIECKGGDSMRRG